MIILYRIYQLLIMLPIWVAATVVCGIITIIGSHLGNGHWWGYYPAHIWARIMCWSALVKVETKGHENISKTTSYVFVANHQGAFDIFTIYGFLNHNFKWMMKKELIKFPVVGPSCRAAGHIFVDNSSAAAVKHTMEKAEATLKDGMSLVVFPEGSRTFTGKMGSFRRGAFQLAYEFQLPVVPVTIDGAFDVMPRTTIIPHWGKIKLTIHKPIIPPVNEADRGRVMEDAREAVHSALPERYQ